MKNPNFHCLIIKTLNKQISEYILNEEECLVYFAIIDYCVTKVGRIC